MIAAYVHATNDDRLDLPDTGSSLTTITNATAYYPKGLHIIRKPDGRDDGAMSLQASKRDWKGVLDLCCTAHGGLGGRIYGPAIAGG